MTHETLFDARLDALNRIFETVQDGIDIINAHAEKASVLLGKQHYYLTCNGDTDVARQRSHAFGMPDRVDAGPEDASHGGTWSGASSTVRLRASNEEAILREKIGDCRHAWLQYHDAVRGVEVAGETLKTALQGVLEKTDVEGHVHLHFLRGAPRQPEMTDYVEIDGLRIMGREIGREANPNRRDAFRACAQRFLHVTQAAFARARQYPYETSLAIYTIQFKEGGRSRCIPGMSASRRKAILRPNCRVLAQSPEEAVWRSLGLMACQIHEVSDPDTIRDDLDRMVQTLPVTIASIHQLRSIDHEASPGFPALGT